MGGRIGIRFLVLARELCVAGYEVWTYLFEGFGDEDVEVGAVFLDLSL